MESAFSLELFVLQKRVKEISSNSHTAANSVDSIFTLVVVGAGFSDVVVGGSMVVGAGFSDVVVSTVSEVPPHAVKHRRTKISKSNFFI